MLVPQLLGHAVAEEGAHHHHVAVGEVDELQHPVDHRVAQGHQGVDGAGGDPVDEVLREVRHQGAMVATYFVLPLPTSRTTAGLVAFRFSSRVMVPVTPAKFLVWAIASRIAARSKLGARLMASTATIAASYPRAASESGTEPKAAL